MAGSGLFYLVVGLGAVAWLAGGLRTIEAAPEAAAVLPAKPADTPLIGTGFSEVSIPRAPDGKFYAEASVNGTRVRFLIDTGATGIVLTTADARRVGLGTGE